MLSGFQSGIWTALPGIVQSVDLSAMTCEVQPSIMGAIKNEDGEVTSVNYPLLLDVPIVFPSAGGFLVTLPITKGDEVLVIFASRAIDSWWQSGGFNNVPVEARMHDLSDGFCIPGPRSQPNVVDSISSTDLQIRNDAGTTFISITAAGKIKLTSPSEIDISAPTVSVTGALTVSGEVTGNGIPLSTHTHPVTTAPGTTGAPT